MKPKVFVTRPLPAAALELLLRDCDVRSYPEDAAIPASQLGEECREVEGILVNSARVSADVLQSAPRLRAISNCGVGYDNIDVAACNRRRIPITNTAGSLEETTADLAFMLLLATARRAIEADRYVREGRWERWQWGLMHGFDVHHKTLGLLGFGGIGQPMARRGFGFSMRVLYYTRRRAAESVERELHAQYAEFETLLRESDYVSLHVPLTPETHHIISGKALSQMKRNAILVNTARGPVVDEKALVEALSSGKIAGAGLDVFEDEPRVNPDLLGLDNVVLAPHIGSATGETRLRMATLAAKNLLAMLAGERPANIVNPGIYS
ncbi:MAG: D-glycerate dehydrogenase [Acidobacteria bacterium]|nr:MAG: D-glycerate dehydrogenase [Acidobacteriota bacterium]